MASKQFQKPTGTKDIFGKQQLYFEIIESFSKIVAKEYNFEKIETPILEDKNLFIRSVGKDSDIVQKEIYSLETKGGDILALRPEGTASVVRSYIENNLYTKPQPVKLFYFGPFFRYERPQKGRYRQFYQFGLEVIGKSSPAIDAQIIQVFYQIFEKLGLSIFFNINSLGCKECRPDYKRKLKKFLKSNKDELCQDCQSRFEANPLRALDCKEDSCQKIIQDAPQIVDFLCKSCNKDLKEVLEYLDELNVPYNLSPFLVRGLDYYNKTVFEIFAEKDNLALGGGGRYDDLIETLGGNETFAAGGAIGVDRIAYLMEEKNIKIEENPKKVFLAQLGNGAKKKAFKLFEEFRKNNIPVYETIGRDSLKSQLSMADRLKVDYTLIIGGQESINEEIMIREMKTGRQETIKIKNVIEEIKKRL